MTAEHRYQSRLFNLILQQSRELTEQWQRNLRQAKVTSMWGMQMGLYPIYLLFQVTRFTQQTLRQGDVQGQRLLKAVADPDQNSWASEADGPIRKVLEAIQIETLDPEVDSDPTVDIKTSSEPRFSVHIEGLSYQRPTIRVRYQKWLQRWADRNPLHHQTTRWLGMTSEPDLRLQGIACDVSTKNIVLVTPTNDSLDVLILAQQRELQKLMTWEMAHYRRQQCLGRELQQLATFNLRQLPIPKLRSQMLPPVKTFRKAMAWVQSGPMAAKVNLFQEALTLPGESATDILPLTLPKELAATLYQLTPKLTQDAIEMLDGAISSWETTSWQVMGPTTTDISDYVVQHWQQQQAQFQSSLSLLTQDAHLANQPATHPLRSAASGVPSTLRSAMNALLGWSSTPSLQSPTPDVSTPSSQPSTHPPLRTLAWPNAYGPGMTAPTPTVVNDVDVPHQSIHTEDGSIEIEIDAVMMGYEKHPLERILAGLDRLTAWFERNFGNLWKRFILHLRSYLQQVLFR